MDVAKWSNPETEITKLALDHSIVGGVRRADAPTATSSSSGARHVEPGRPTPQPWPRRSHRQPRWRRDLGACGCCRRWRTPTWRRVPLSHNLRARSRAQATRSSPGCGRRQTYSSYGPRAFRLRPRPAAWSGKPPPRAARQHIAAIARPPAESPDCDEKAPNRRRDRKSTRLNSSHGYISYAVFCLKKKKKKTESSLHRLTLSLTTSPA